MVPVMGPDSVDAVTCHPPLWCSVGVPPPVDWPPSGGTSPRGISCRGSPRKIPPATSCGGSLPGPCLSGRRDERRSTAQSHTVRPTAAAIGMVTMARNEPDIAFTSSACPYPAGGRHACWSCWWPRTGGHSFLDGGQTVAAWGTRHGVLEPRLCRRRAYRRDRRGATASLCGARREGVDLAIRADFRRRSSWRSSALAPPHTPWT